MDDVALGVDDEAGAQRVHGGRAPVLLLLEELAEHVGEGEAGRQLRRLLGFDLFRGFGGGDVDHRRFHLGHQLGKARRVGDRGEVQRAGGGGICQGDATTQEAACQQRRRKGGGAPVGGAGLHSCHDCLHSVRKTHGVEIKSGGYSDAERKMNKN